MYRDTFRELAKWGRNKEESLKRLERDPIGDEDALALDSPRLVEFIKTRRLEGAGPSTAGNDLVWIGVVLRAAKNVDRKPVNPDIVDEAREICRELRLIGKSRRRYRRPTDSELEQALSGTQNIPNRSTAIIGASDTHKRRGTSFSASQGQMRGFSPINRKVSVRHSPEHANFQASRTSTF